MAGAVPWVLPHVRFWLSLRTLRRAAAMTYRGVPGRLAGFAWTPKGPPNKEARATTMVFSETTIRGVATGVLRRVRNDASPESQHVEGLAYVLSSHLDEALAALRKAVAADTAEAWNDLAVVRDATAMRQGRDSQWPAALFAVDRALQIEPRFAEAAFNRALILEQMGLTAPARSAWKHYLEIDGASAWSVEAQEHLRALPSPATSDFKRDLAATRNAFIAGRRGAVAVLVRESPQESRTWGEAPLLGEWGRLVGRKQTAAAATQLDFVNAIANALAATSGERLLADEVAVIHATNDPERLRLLADAHAHYDAGRKLLGERGYGKGRMVLDLAAEQFSRAGAPMADVARYFAAVARFEQNDVAGARAGLVALVDRCDRSRHKALYAQELWQLARCDLFQGAWSTAFDGHLAAMHAFAQLGERANEIVMQSVVADMFEEIGNGDHAWQLRAGVFAALSERNATNSIARAMANAVRSALRMHRYDAATALANLTIEFARAERDPLILADAQIQRARIAAERGAATVDLEEARRAVSTIADTALRRRSEVDLSVVEGILRSREEPQASMALLGNAIKFYERHELSFSIANAYLQRSRARSAAHDDAGAIQDADRALAEVERQRAAVRDDNRALFFDTAADVFEQAILLRLRAKDAADAYAIAERAQARTLAEGRHVESAQPATIRTALAPGEALLQYAYIPEGVAAFVVTREGTSAEVVSLDREALSEQIDSLRRLIRAREPVGDIRAAGEALERALIAPVRARIEDHPDLIIVADRDLQNVPFAALASGASGKFLVEEHAITIAPSGTFATLVAARPIQSALFAGNPAAPAFDSLGGAEAEARESAALYPAATTLLAREASRSRFIAAAAETSLIEFAGHTTGAGTDMPALVLAPADGDDGLLSSAAISHLSLQRSAIVVLATCSSARGRESHVEGTPTLSRAFLAAGAPTVVGTLWDIDDARSTPLFVAFHRRFSRGVPAPRALQQAQLAALQSPDANTRHPATWAPIEIFGTGRRLQQ